ncbi:hypothetical protein GGR54DRAFT_644398 [Hypoxylon sp. NC1633]|nr:hypothetical protein GGR54DRAFT_644398 [Hypoxylon sp. NC1633]
MPQDCAGKRTHTDVLPEGKNSKRPRIDDEKRIAKVDEPAAESSEPEALEDPQVKTEDNNDKNDLVSIPAAKLEPSGSDLPLAALPQHWQHQDGGVGERMMVNGPPPIPPIISMEEVILLISIPGQPDIEPEDVGNVYRMISESPYGNGFFNPLMSNPYIYPTAMMAKLAASYKLRKAGPRATGIPPPRKAYAVLRAQNVFLSPVVMTGVLWLCESREQANIAAMKYFSTRFSAHVAVDSFMVNNAGLLGEPEASVRNWHNAPFMEMENYQGRGSFFQFFKEQGSRNCSAWGVDPAGGLGLLATNGNRELHLVWVEAWEYMKLT